jgi:hypothetical protein
MATVTITTDAGMDARLAPGLRRLSASRQECHHAAEVKAWLIEQMRTVVRNYEDQVAKAAVAAPASFDPT